MWVVIGDNEYSCFGENTCDSVFGNLYYCSKAELSTFAETLKKDVRQYEDRELLELFYEWEKK